jgi:hypothetical protein
VSDPVVPPASTPDYSGPPDGSDPLGTSKPAPGGWLRLLLGLGLTAALLVGVVLAWPDGGGDADTGDDEAGPRAPTTLVDGSPGPDLPGLTPGPSPGDEEDVDLFSEGAAEAVAEVLEAAGDPQQVFELAIYPTYLFVAYRDPAEPSHLDRRMWRGGSVQPADANPIDDRVDADTEPGLFAPGEVDLGRLPAMVADARTRYGVPVDATHVLIDRFLPFDRRVLVRVYATPSDGRSGGGYVTYTPDGTFVDVCC